MNCSARSPSGSTIRQLLDETEGLLPRGRRPPSNKNPERKMAKYGKAAAKSVESAMHREKKGTLKSGKDGKGGTVKSKKQAIAIGLSEASKKGKKVPKKKKRKKKSSLKRKS